MTPSKLKDCQDKARTSSRTHKATVSRKTKREQVRALPKFIVFLLLIAGCANDKARTSSRTPKAAPLDPWVITNLDPNVAAQALLWNGEIGIRFGTEGTGQGPVFMIREYDKTGEEKISPLPNPLAGTWTASSNGESLDLNPSGANDFKSELNLQTGELTSSWTQKLNAIKIRVQVRTQMHPNKSQLEQRWKISSDTYVELSFQSSHQPSLSASEILRQPNSIHWRLSKSAGAFEHDLMSKDNRHADPRAEMFMPWTVTGSLKMSAAADTGKPFELTRRIQFGNPPDLSGTKGKSVDHEIRALTAEAWQTDIQIDGPIEDQQFIRSALFYLRGAIHPGEKMSISPMGLSSDIYNGHVFWDADIWVFPALALIDPERAKAIPQYRLNHLPQAAKNFKDWWQKEDRPTGNGKMGFLAVEGVPPFGIKFPWESSVSGKETVPGPSKFEDHITGSIAFSMSQASDLGLISSEDESNFLNKADQFYRTRSILKDGQFEIKGTMSPDENHIGDNDLYTNLVAQWCMNNASWDTEAVKKRMAQIRTFWAPYKLPKDDKSFLTYDNDGLRGYKQAAAVLSIYPLQYPPAEKQAKVMMERFADKVTKNGPAMTDSIHSIIWSRLGEKEKAYQAWHDSWKPFVKPPFLLFSEKRNSSRTYFTTGAAGSLQAVLYGFAGIRIDTKKAPNAQWSIPLKNGKILSIAPNLPKEWKKLTLRNLTILGRKYTFEIVGDKVTVS